MKFLCRITLYKPVFVVTQPDALALLVQESQQRATELEDELVRADERLAAANKQLQQLQDSRAAPSPQPLDGPQAG